MKISDWRIAIFVTAFGLGWGASEAIMKMAGQDKVLHGMYVLRDDLKAGYVEKGQYDQSVADHEATKSKLAAVETERDGLKAKVAELVDKKGRRAELENELGMLRYSLEVKRTSLGMATQMEGIIQAGGQGDTPRNTEAIPQIKHDISVIEARIAEINKYLMDN